MFEHFTIIPAIDLYDGKVVRLAQGDFSCVTEYGSDPLAVASEFERQGAEILHIVDLNGAKTGEFRNFDLIREMRSAIRCKLEVSGGLRSMDTIDKVFAAGADLISLGSASVIFPELVREAVRQYPGRVLGSLDSRNGKIAIKGWLEQSELNVFDAFKRLRDLGIAAIIYTDISRDGLETGINLDGLRSLAVLSDIPIIASGGVASLEDIRRVRQLSNLGVLGVIVGKALYAGRFSLKQAIEEAESFT